MRAVIEVGSHQHVVEEGDVLAVERTGSEVGEVIELPVLGLLDGRNVQIGRPFVENAVVKAVVKGEIKAPKIRGFTYKAKVNSRRRFGHRQHYDLIEILEISASQGLKKQLSD